MPIVSIRRFVYWASLIISTFLFVFSRTIRDWVAIGLTALNITNADVILFAMFIAGLFLLVAARLVSEGIPKYFSWARAEMMGNNLIEGQWIDTVYEKDGCTVKSVGLISISYQDGLLVAKGTDHDPDGTMHSSFVSIISRIYDTGEFRYCYEARMLLQPTFTNHRGYAEYTFETLAGVPTEFKGVFSSASTGQRHITSGNKITPELLRDLNLEHQSHHATENDRTKLITTYRDFKTRA